jgi:hypothetical protein
MDVVPDWEYALFSENEVESYLEVPLISDTHLGVGPVGVTDESQSHMTDRRLVVRQIKETGQMYLYTSIWIPDDEASLLAMPSLTMFDKGLFSGRIYFFHPDGTFYWGARFSEGEVVASLSIVEEEDIAPTTRSITIYTCVFTIDTWSSYLCDGYDETGLPTGCHLMYSYTTSFTVECDVTTVLTGGEGGGTGGTGSTPPPPDDEETFTVTASASPMNGGIVVGGGTYSLNDDVILVAAPNEGFEFVSWSGDSSSSSYSITVTVTEDMSFTAMFRYVEEPSDPCANMRNKMGDSDFTSMLNALTGLTSTNYESGRAYTFSNGNYSFTTHNGEANTHEIAWDPSSSNMIDGFIHTHVGGGLPIFSASDLLIPGKWNSLGGINDLSSFSLGVVTAGGTYFLQVTDPAAYLAFFSTYANMQGLLEGAYGIYIGTNTSPADAVRYLALLLEMENSGLTLMKQNGNGFRKMEVDSNNNVNELFCR